jgi:hypothetical protein
MKIKLNKQTLADMPEPVRNLVAEWKERYRKAHISVENVTGFYAPEDATVTMLNLTSGDEATARAAGEFAGYTKLSPTAKIPLPVGCVAVVKYFFCGHPMLTVYQGSNTQIQ